MTAMTIISVHIGKMRLRSNHAFDNSVISDQLL
jgi:hypothetical protein